MRIVYLIIWLLITAILCYLLYELNENQQVVPAQIENSDDKIQVIDEVSGSAYATDPSSEDENSLNSDNNENDSGNLESNTEAISSEMNDSNSAEINSSDENNNVNNNNDDSTSENVDEDKTNISQASKPNTQNKNIPGMDEGKFLEKAYIEFNQNKTTIQTDERLGSYLDSVAQAVNNADLYVILEGHADKSLSKKHDNYTVGLKRANFIKNALVSRGLSENKIEVISKSDDEPRIDSDTPEARKSNRRVELIIKQKN